MSSNPFVPLMHRLTHQVAEVKGTLAIETRLVVEGDEMICHTLLDQLITKCPDDEWEWLCLGAALATENLMKAILFGFDEFDDYEECET